MKKKGRVLKIVLLTIGALFLGGFLGGTIFVLSIISRAPDLDILDATPEGYRSSVLNTEEEVVLTLSGEASNRVYVKLSEVPEDLQHAFVAIEDERFYQHHGIDIKGILRAAFQGIASGGHFSQGASTITQQLLKNNVFSAWTEETSFMDKLERKIQEQYLAVKLERKVSKEWILENYLNTINLGGGNWGVETAARYYFDKDVSDLTLGESAAIASITKNPTSFNPALHPEQNDERRRYVLKRMLEQDYITEGEYQAAIDENIYETITEVKANGTSQQIMTYFEDAMLYQVLDDLMLATGCDEGDAWDMIYRGGLTIYSTEDSSLQRICEEAVAHADVPSEAVQMSVVIIDNDTGQIRAMVGGRGKKEANLILNRAASSKRQPGSTIKVVGEYALAIEEGEIGIGSVYDDAPTAYTDGTPVHNSNGEYQGKITVHQAIVDSCNTVAVKTFLQMGILPVMENLQNFGISTLTEKDRVESLALGGTSGGVTNLEMTSAYSVLARGGEYVEPLYYTKILDHNGDVLIEKTAAEHDVLRTDTAALLTAAMCDVMKSGTGSAAGFEGMSLAGKTGTTTGARDAWMIGYSPYLTCGVWGGLDDNSKQEDSSYVKAVWKEVMETAHEGKSDPGFSDLARLNKTRICTKCGKLAVEGLCDSTVSGDQTAEEYFAAGTEPTESCDCHYEITICSDSRQIPNSYCPGTERLVYLKEASEETADQETLKPAGTGETECTEHHAPTPVIPWFQPHQDNSRDENQDSGGSWWESWFGSSDDSSDNSQDSQYNQDSQDNQYNQDNQDNQDTQDDSGGNWWDNLFGR